MPPQPQPRLRYRAMHVLVAADAGGIGVIREMVAAEIVEDRHRARAQLLTFPCGTILR